MDLRDDDVLMSDLCDAGLGIVALPLLAGHRLVTTGAPSASESLSGIDRWDADLLIRDFSDGDFDTPPLGGRGLNALSEYCWASEACMCSCRFVGEH